MTRRLYHGLRYRTGRDGPRMRPRSFEQTNTKLPPDTVAYRRRPCAGVANAPDSRECSSWLPMLASDFGEEHETQVAFARTSPHRTDPACVMGRDRPGTN